MVYSDITENINEVIRRLFCRWIVFPRDCLPRGLAKKGRVPREDGFQRLDSLAYEFLG